MHDFDYDAMQKKRIARGAAHMKRGSKSKKCTLPSDYLTAAQKRRLNGPVSTYKLDEPMNWESFKAMPEDLQKKYILNLQETYQANNDMLGKMFGVTGVSVCKMRHALGIGAMGKSKMTRDEVAVRDAKWDAFCNGVVGGKPKEMKKEEVKESHNEIEEFESFDDSTKEPETIDISKSEDIAEAPTISILKPRNSEDIAEAPTISILKPSKLDVSFDIDSCDLDKAYEMFRRMDLPTGKVRIRFEVEEV